MPWWRGWRWTRWQWSSPYGGRLQASPGAVLLVVFGAFECVGVAMAERAYVWCGLHRCRFFVCGTSRSVPTMLAIPLLLGCSVCFVASLVEHCDTCLWLLSAWCWLIVSSGEVVPEFFSIGSGGSEGSSQDCFVLVSADAVLPQGLWCAVGLVGVFWQVFPERCLGGSGGDGGLVSAVGVWLAVLLVEASVSHCGVASCAWKRLIGEVVPFSIELLREDCSAVHFCLAFSCKHCSGVCSVVPRLVPWRLSTSSFWCLASLSVAKEMALLALARQRLAAVFAPRVAVSVLRVLSAPWSRRSCCALEVVGFLCASVVDL
ncbi:hypothetical protein Taro_049157 [Colocasia esculenta]|uniref:Uncharacterized protein n=1 Tax=Colocasia esculenta TaxID=4460 RepID=A0A843XA70_COLES|nr:hypothetical protein [Colocasia esculenta]